MTDNQSHMSYAGAPLTARAGPLALGIMGWVFGLAVVSNRLNFAVLGGLFSHFVKRIPLKRTFSRSIRVCFVNELTLSDDRCPRSRGGGWR